MDEYLKEQDAYESFLVTGHSASRSNVGEAGLWTDPALISMGGDKAHTTGECFARVSSYTVQILNVCQESPKSDVVIRMRKRYAINLQLIDATAQLGICI